MKAFTVSLRRNIILHHIKKHDFILIINQSQLIKTTYFQIYFIYTIKWRWLGPIFGIFHDFLTHFNHSTTYGTQNIWHCPLTVLITKILDLWSIMFLVFLACKHELLCQKWANWSYTGFEAHFIFLFLYSHIIAYIQNMKPLKHKK